MRMMIELRDALAAYKARTGHIDTPHDTLATEVEQGAARLVTVFYDTRTGRAASVLGVTPWMPIADLCKHLRGDE